MEDAPLLLLVVIPHASDILSEALRLDHTKFSKNFLRCD
jgi:hypothetical protein